MTALRLRHGLGPAATVAMATSAVMSIYQVGSRAARDTLFLSHFPVASLPLMIAAASVTSIASALIAAQVMSRRGPMRFIPAAFAVSAALTLAEWALTLRAPRAGSIAVYLHVAAFGPVVVSGFWSIVNEQFDPRAAKRAVGWIAGIGTLGGLLGGLLAERMTAWFGAPGTLPALALTHVACAITTTRMPRPVESVTRRRHEPLDRDEARRRLVATPYLRNLALLVFGSSLSAALLDYVFKAQTAAATHGSLELVRVFSGFYAVVSVLTFAIQAILSRVALERGGLTRTIGSLPAAVVAGGLAAVLAPGAWVVGVVRGLESVLRGSLFRAGYELLYTPIPPAEKRATKTLVDVGCDRLGDAVGAAVIATVLLLVTSASTVVLLALSVGFAAATLGVVARLQRGYVSSLEAGLRAGSAHLDPEEIEDGSTRIALQRTLWGAAPPEAPRPADDVPLDYSRTLALKDLAIAVTRAGDAPPPATAPAALDEHAQRLAAMRSGDAERVKVALRDGPLAGGLVAQAIELLAWNEVARDAIAHLVPVAARHTGQLVDALLDPDSDFAVRRRIPAILATAPTSRAVEGLTRSLADGRFEVRYRSGRALARILERETSLQVDPDLVFGAVRREATVGRHVWESQRLLDQLDERGEEGFIDDFLRDRAGRSLEHAFTLLSLVLPREPLRIAFRGLYAGDPLLRGTALEYLETVLPADVRLVLWPYLEPAAPSARAAGRDREQVLEDLLRSNQSIEIDLEALRRRFREAPPGAAE